MNKSNLEKSIIDYINESGLNIISEEKALLPEAIGLEIFDTPIFGYASSENEYLNTLKDYPDANIKLDIPSFWLDSAQTVISFFLPYKEQVKKSNINGTKPSIEWLHGRIEGQFLINNILEYLQNLLVNQGHKAVIPMFDKKFKAAMNEKTKERDFGSNWSERHVAFAAGLGTFSFSKGLITEKGVAGRFGSLITSASFDPTIPTYTNLTEYCSMCGVCIIRCPMDAISLDHGKLHKPCADYLDDILSENPPYYGCGKCQVGVPCESNIPKF